MSAALVLSTAAGKLYVTDFVIRLFYLTELVAIVCN